MPLTLLYFISLFLCGTPWMYVPWCERRVVPIKGLMEIAYNFYPVPPKYDSLNDNLASQKPGLHTFSIFLAPSTPPNLSH